MESNQTKENSLNSVIIENRLYDSDDENIPFIIDDEKNQIYDWRKIPICGQNKLNQKLITDYDISPSNLINRFNEFDFVIYKNIENLKNLVINKQIEEDDGSYNIHQTKIKIRYHSVILESANDIFLHYRRKKCFKALKRHVKPHYLLNNITFFILGYFELESN